MIQPRTYLVTKSPTLTHLPIEAPVVKPAEPAPVEETKLTEPVIVQKPALVLPAIVIKDKKEPKPNNYEDFICELRDLVETFTTGQPIRYDYEVREEILALFKKHKL